MNLDSNRLHWFTLVVIAVVSACSCSCRTQRKETAPPRELSVFMSMLDPKGTLVHFQATPCEDRIQVPLNQGPIMLWTDNTQGAFDGMLVNVFGAGSANVANRLMFFHWSTADSTVILFAHESIVMDSTVLKWSTVLHNVTSAFVFKTNGDPIAQIEFGALHNKVSGAEEDAMIFYQLSGSDLLEHIVAGTSWPISDGSCFFQNSSALNSLVGNILAKREAIDPSAFSPSEGDKNVVLHRFISQKH